MSERYHGSDAHQLSLVELRRYKIVSIRSKLIKARNGVVCHSQISLKEETAFRNLDSTIELRIFLKGD